MIFHEVLKTSKRKKNERSEIEKTRRAIKATRVGYKQVL